MPQKPNPEYDAYDDLFWVRVNNEENIIRYLFTGYVRYVPAYGEPTGNYNKEKDQLTLHETTTYPPTTPNGKIPEIALSLGLSIGDNKKTIEQKIGKRLTGKRIASDGGSFYEPFFNEFRLLLALDSREQLRWLTLFKLELYEKERIRLKVLLKLQNKNIDPNRTPEIQVFLSEIPIIQRRKRTAQGDDMSSKESVTAVETALTEYMQALCEAIQKRNVTTVYNSMGKLVKKINNISDKYRLIETTGREEFCEWPNIFIRKTGLELVDNVDITDEYHE